jgi:hypothetical protein
LRRRPVDNPTGRDARVAVSMRVSAAQPPASLRVTGDVWNEALIVGPDGAVISRSLLVPAGRHLIHLRSGGAPVIAARESRRLVFRVDEASLRRIDE